MMMQSKYSLPRNDEKIMTLEMLNSTFFQIQYIYFYPSAE